MPWAGSAGIFQVKQYLVASHKPRREWRIKPGETRSTGGSQPGRPQGSSQGPKMPLIARPTPAPAVPDRRGKTLGNSPQMHVGIYGDGRVLDRETFRKNKSNPELWLSRLAGLPLDSL